MPKTVRFHENAYHNEYGFFAKDTVYENVPDDMKLPSGAEEIDKPDEMDNVKTKPFDGLITSGISKKKTNAKEVTKRNSEGPKKKAPAKTAS